MALDESECLIRDTDGTVRKPADEDEVIRHKDDHQHLQLPQRDSRPASLISR